MAKQAFAAASIFAKIFLKPKTRVKIKIAGINISTIIEFSALIALTLKIGNITPAADAARFVKYILFELPRAKSREIIIAENTNGSTR